MLERVEVPQRSERRWPVLGMPPQDAIVLRNRQRTEIRTGLRRRGTQNYRYIANRPCRVSTAIDAYDACVVAELVVAVADFRIDRAGGTRWRRAVERLLKIAMKHDSIIHQAKHFRAGCRIYEVALCQ